MYFREAFEAGAEQFDGLRANLADPRFGQAQERADFLHGFAVEIVHLDHRAFVLGKPLDRQLADLFALQSGQGIFLALVGQHFQRLQVAARVVIARFVPAVFQRDLYADFAYFPLERHEFIQRHLHARGDLVVQRLAVQFDPKRGHGPGQFLRLAAHQPRHPIRGPQVIQDGPANP